MSNSLFVLVRPKKGGRERHITKRAYQLASNKWDLVQGQEAQVTLPQQPQKKSEAAEVVANAEIEVISFKNELTEKESKELKETESTMIMDEMKEPLKKRGRKPKQA